MNSERRLTQKTIPEQCDESHYEKVILCDVLELETPAWHVEEGDNQTSEAWGHQDKDTVRNVLSLYSRLSSTISNFCIRRGVAETGPTCRSERPSLNRRLDLHPTSKYLFNYFTSWPQFPPSLLLPVLSPSPLLPPNPLPFLFRKWQT